LFICVRAVACSDDTPQIGGLLGVSPLNSMTRRQEKWLVELRRERLLPTPKVAAVAFLAMYLITFAWKMLAPGPWPIGLGLLATTTLSVYLAKLLIRCLLQGDISGRKGGPIMQGVTLYPLVLASFLPSYLLLLFCFIKIYSMIPSAPFGGQG